MASEKDLVVSLVVVLSDLQVHNHFIKRFTFSVLQKRFFWKILPKN